MATRTLRRGLVLSPLEKLLRKILPVDEDQYDNLYADIKVNGIRQPIERDVETKDILDGLTRAEIAKKLGIDCPERLVEGLQDDNERIAYAIRANTNRRQLTHDQRESIRAEQQRLAVAFYEAGKNQAETAALLGVDQKTISRWLSDRQVPTTKLSDADIEMIIEMLAQGVKRSEIAKKFGVTPARITQIAQEYEYRWRSFPTEVGDVEIRCGDARDHFPDDLADIAFFSPPYNAGVQYEGDLTYDALDDDHWRDLLTTALEVLRDGWQVARIIVNLPAALDRNPYRPVELPWIQGLTLEAAIVWDKGTTGNRTSWGSWRLPTAPAIRDRTERLYVYRTQHDLRLDESTFTEDKDGRRVSPFLPSALFTMLTQDLWNVPPESAWVGHPAPFPIELARRVISLYGWPGCRVIDPFAGSGTTGLAANELDCRAVLIDQAEDYCRLALKRILESTRS
jgi:modification methylase